MRNHMDHLSRILFPTILITGLLCCVSCSDSDKRSREAEPAEIRAAVYLSAGDIYPLFNELDVPTFFNLGKVISGTEKDINTIILSERAKKGSKMDIRPLALFSFDRDTVHYNYIVSVPADQTNERIGVDFNDFLLKNYKTQNNIENWFSSQCPDYTCRNFRWDNTYKALLEINKREFN